MPAEGEERWTEPEMMVSKARFEEVQQENDDLAKLLDEAIDREKVREAVIERIGIERQNASVDLERVQEAGRQLATELRVLAKAVEPSGNWAMVAPTTLYRMADLADGGALAEARERMRAPCRKCGAAEFGECVYPDDPECLERLRIEARGRGEQ